MGLVNINASDYLQPVTYKSRHTHNFTYKVPYGKQDYFNISFFPRTISDWNKLPSDIVNKPPIDSFSIGLDKYLSKE